jgi:hypothetical protein
VRFAPLIDQISGDRESAEATRTLLFIDRTTTTHPLSFLWVSLRPIGFLNKFIFSGEIGVG